MQPNEKPAVVFSTPCIQSGKMTHGALLSSLSRPSCFMMIGQVNEADSCQRDSGRSVSGRPCPRQGVEAISLADHS